LRCFFMMKFVTTPTQSFGEVLVVAKWRPPKAVFY